MMTREELALIRLAHAQRAVELSHDAVPLQRDLAAGRLARATEEARALGLLPTEEEILAARKEWATKRLIARHARLHNSIVLPDVPDEVTDACSTAMGDAVAVAEEWGLAVDEIIEEATR